MPARRRLHFIPQVPSTVTDAKEIDTNVLSIATHLGYSWCSESLERRLVMDIQLKSSMSLSSFSQDLKTVPGFQGTLSVRLDGVQLISAFGMQDARLAVVLKQNNSSNKSTRIQTSLWTRNGEMVHMCGEDSFNNLPTFALQSHREIS